MPRIIETTVYNIDDHPAPDKVREWVRNNWHDLGDYSISEMVDSLNAFADHIGARVSYSLSIVPDRGESISFDFGDVAAPSFSDLVNILDLSGNCPLTGIWADEVILDAFRGDDIATSDAFHTVEYNVLKALHTEGDYIYSDEGLTEFIKANEYEFTIDGVAV